MIGCIKGIQNAIEYIEDNLTEELKIQDIAERACISAFYFQRIFNTLCGFTVGEYIRNRRLSIAAQELSKSDARVIDVALKYGYDSPDSFARAFQNMHGVKPSEAREKGVQLKVFPRMSFQIIIKGDMEMEYRLEELDFELRIVGKRKTVNTKKAFEEIPALWNGSKKDGFMQKLIDMSWENPKCKLESLLGICGKEAAIMDEEFDYFMGVRYDGVVPEGMEVLIIPSGLWAVFPNVIDAWKRLYSEWLPTSGYELANLPCIECHYPPGHDPDNELWVPIVKK